jgi:(R,R)-butanediol dehydrogenase/meso-butanediol dehydrogenase/diacetyl reductase
MRAARFYGAKDIRVEDVPEPPAELGPTQVLLRPRLCGICGSDLSEYLSGPISLAKQPHPLTGARLPQILGHEFSADVEAVGAEVSTVAPGDRAVVMPLIFCGECAYCRRGLNHACTRIGCVGETWDWGGMAEWAMVEQYQVMKLPENVSYEQAALIEPAAVAIGAVQRAGMQVGDTVLVTGAGPIGALSVLAARAAGAAQVFLSEPNEKRASRAAGLEPSAIFDPTSTDVSAELQERTNGLGVDVAIECSGNNAALRTCMQATRTLGTVAQVGLHVKDASIDAWALSERQISLVGVWAFSVPDFPRIAAQVDSGALPVERVITSSIPLEDVVHSGFEALADPAGSQIKVLVAA